MEVKFCERQIRLPATKSLAASTIGRPTSISCVTLPTGSFEPVELPKRHCIADACCAIANPASPTTDRSVLRANLLKFMVYLTVLALQGQFLISHGHLFVAHVRRDRQYTLLIGFRAPFDRQFLTRLHAGNIGRAVQATVPLLRPDSLNTPAPMAG